MLDYFGLKDSEKMIIIGTIDWHDWPKLCRRLLRKMGLEAPGTGVSFVIPGQQRRRGQAVTILKRREDAAAEGGERDEKHRL